MNLNLFAYSIFLAIAVFIIGFVGQICYRNGNVFVLALIPGHRDLCVKINRTLLTGYYLVNVGYAATTLASWEPISNFAQVVESVAQKTAIIVSILTVLHYLNIFLISNHVKKLIQ
ncbi:hypothetical protein [Flavobacterium sp.]|uniref:hypothetical protein n=1 Tax=Flavobacterium sp. TaxID=239 RepID=UPI0012146629|nr:hypothetical protein [Flavobacterium sp.]RZJ70060.1 MAG: hypothetical protein EOO49_15520 [Flavobacterium sp.]